LHSLNQVMIHALN